MSTPASPNPDANADADASPNYHAHIFPRDYRRRSADVGGLHRALAAAAEAAAAAAASHGALERSMMFADGSEGWEADRDRDASPHAAYDYDYNGVSGAGVAGPFAFGAQGQGWMGGEGGDMETMYAELLSDMYNETLNSLNDNSLDSTPPPVPENVRTRLIWQLDKWHFEPHRLPDEEVLACTLLLFEALFRIEGMESVIPLSMDQITSFIHHLRRIYRFENSYHNFEHALDVLQATQSYLKSAGVVPPITILFQPPSARWTPQLRGGSGSLMATLGKRELFMLYVGAIGHDVGHPGFSNVFMKNAQAPLALLFNHGSALEHMHCHLLLQLMRFHGFNALLDDPQHGAHLRKLLKESVLATDMGVHPAFMKRLESVVRGEQMSVCARQVVLCQALLKNADISNPTRPFLVSKHWATALQQEWAAQAHLEAQYHLQQTVPLASADPLKEADSQIFFVKTFVRPLLELTEKAVPEMGMYTRWCKMNLGTWVRRREGLVAGGGGAGGGVEGGAEGGQREGNGADDTAETNVLDEQPSEEEGVELVIVDASSPSLSSSHSAYASSTPGSVSGSGSGSTSTSTSLQNSPIPPPLSVSPRLSHHLRSPSPSPSQLQYHTAFPLTLPPPPVSSHSRLHSRSHTASNSNSSASSSSGRSCSHSHSHPHSPALSLLVPDSPSTETEASECRSVGSASSSSALSINGNLSEMSTPLGLGIGLGVGGGLGGGFGAPSLSGMSVYSMSGVSMSTAPSASASTTASAALAIRAAGKVGMGSWRKKSQTGLNSHGGVGTSRLPPLPAKVAASLSVSSSSSMSLGAPGSVSVSSGGLGLGSGSNAGSSSLSTPNGHGNGKNGVNGSSTNGASDGASTGSMTGTTGTTTGPSTEKEKEKILKSKASNTNSFRFKSSARNSWCASPVTGLGGLFGGQSPSSGQPSQARQKQPPSQAPQEQAPPPPPPCPQPRRDISPLPPGKESWLGAKSSKGKEREREEDNDKENEDLESTPTATRVSISTTSATRSDGDVDEGSGRTSPSPSPSPGLGAGGGGAVNSKSTSPGSVLPLPLPPPQPPSAPAPLMSGRAIKVQVSP